MKHPLQPVTAPRPHVECDEPSPTPRFRRDSWADIQRALDPLGRPRPLRGTELP
jgi:hypothetical protein